MCRHCADVISCFLSNSYFFQFRMYDTRNWRASCDARDPEVFGRVELQQQQQQDGTSITSNGRTDGRLVGINHDIHHARTDSPRVSACVISGSAQQAGRQAGELLRVGSWTWQGNQLSWHLRGNVDCQSQTLALEGTSSRVVFTCSSEALPGSLTLPPPRLSPRLRTLAQVR